MPRIPAVVCPGPRRLSRRDILQVGGAGLLGLSLPRLLRAEEQRPGASSAKADACILIFLNGGPSHLDMWDMKPDAPKEIRGEFKPIATSVSGVQFSEHLPKLARHMHRCTLVRSVHHSVNNSHAAAVYVGLTGHDRGEKGGGAKPTDHPAIGSVLGLCRPPSQPVVPYVSMPYITQEGAGGPPQPGFFGGLLGRTRDPLFVLRNPDAPNFAMPELGLGAEMNATRLDARRRLLDWLRCGADDRSAQEMAGFQGKAFDLLVSPATQKAFRLDLEPLAVRDGYGRNIYGQSVLLARRLIEAGTRVACISWAPDANATWDTHGKNFVSLKNTLLPQLDAAVSSLLNGPGRARPAGTDSGGGDGRVRPFAEGQRRGRPRSLELLLQPDAGRRRLQGRLRSRRQRQDRRPTQSQSRDARRYRRHAVHLPGHRPQPGAERSVGSSLRPGAVGHAHPRTAGVIGGPIRA